MELATELSHSIDDQQLSLLSSSEFDTEEREVKNDLLLSIRNNLLHRFWIVTY